jgi:hypothetical protein
MPYTTQAAIQKAVGGEEALKRYSSISGAEIDVNAIAQAIGAADSDIITSCAGRPGFTDDAFAATIEPVATLLAIGYLFVNVWGDVSDKRWKLQIEGAKKKLEAMAAGTGALTTTSAAPIINTCVAYSFGPNDDIPDDYGRDSSLGQLKGI